MAFQGNVDFDKDGPDFVSSCEQYDQTARWSLGLGHLRVSSNAQLHNRGDLIGALGADLEYASDAFLLVCAYAKWGEECAPKLLGDFAFAVWDNHSKRLFCCRDHMAARSFFYWRNSSRLVFAGDPGTILRCPGVPREFNRSKLVSMSASAGKHFHDEETFHRGILSLPGGACMSVTREGIRKWRYWDPESSTVSVPKRDNEILESLRELLFSSVRARMRGRNSVGAFLSGGLDSSAVVAVAARSLEKDNRTLVALSSVLPEGSKPRLKDERDYIDKFRSWPNIHTEYVTAPGRGPFDHIEDPGYFETSFTWTTRQYLYDAFQEKAAAFGLDVLLDGCGGELGPSCWGFDYFMELAAGFHWVALARELASVRAVRARHPIRVLGGGLLGSLFPNRDFRLWLLFAPEFIRECSTPHARRRHWPNHRRSQIKLLRDVLKRHANVQPPCPPVPYSYPLIDKRLVEFCIAAPTRLKVRDGYERCLVRGALDGILPKEIQWRTSKEPFSPDYYVRFNAQLGKARDLVAAIGSSDPVRTIVDVERLRQMLVPVDPVVGKWEALVSIPATINLILFLRQFAEFRP